MFNRGRLRLRNFGYFYIWLEYNYRTIRFLLRDYKFKYMITYIGIATSGLAVNEMVYCILLLDLINRSQTLLNVINAISFNGESLVLTAFLGVLFMYMFAIFAFHFIDDVYFDLGIADGERTCSTVWQCFMTTFNYGLRNGGGIGDSLKPQSYRT